VEQHRFDAPHGSPYAAGMSNLKGKTVVITGASRGIGAGIAKECLRQGMNVGVCARRAPEIDEGPTVLTMAADVTDGDAVQALADKTVERFGRIDLWINNAGVLKPMAPLRNCASDEVLAHLQVNIMGVFHGIKTFTQHIRSREGEGVLINISSGASTSAYAGWGAYCAGKSAVDMLTEVAQLEEEESGLRAYSVAPGIIDTDMQELIRAADPADFPLVEKFHELKRDDAFSSLDFVAKSLLQIAFSPEHRPDSVCSRLPSEK
jgi:NAD(P)-dependent dehydrogenase (short-subunit alcohol dehydrogenase family)